MARARNIKPGFFTNDELVELPFATRLLFIGLWTIADREGRMVDRPKKIKMEIPLVSPGCSWKSYVDSRGLTAWSIDTVSLTAEFTLPNRTYS